MKPVLELEGFGVAFAAHTILLDMNLSIPALGCCVLLGPSGTGKSTLVRTLAGLNDANSSMRSWGRATYHGEDLSLVRRPALVAQKAHLLMATVQDNLVAKLAHRSSLARALQIEKVRDFLAQSGQDALAGKLATPVIELPLHEQRIIAILRQALPGPALLMVDEPTVSLSPQGAQAILAVLEMLARQRAVLLVSHHLAQTRQIANQVILMADGVVQESASKDDFFLRPQTAAVQQYLRTGSCPESGLGKRGAEQDSLEGDSENQGHDQGQGKGEGEEPAGQEMPLAQAASPALAVTPKTSTALTVSTASTPAAVRQQITPFSCAQRRLHLQPDPAAKSAFCGPRGFVWLIDGKLAGTPWPGIVRDTHQDLQALRHVGITRLISLTETPFDATLALSYDMQCTTVPMPDMHAPSLSQAWFLCHAIDGYLQDGEAVAVHCKAGLGRTGTVLALYWIWLQAGQVSGAAATAYIRRQETGMIQSREQENFLEKFARLVAHLPAGTIHASPDLALETDFFKTASLPTESPP